MAMNHYGVKVIAFPERSFVDDLGVSCVPVIRSSTEDNN
jgi:hypothetical protein